LKVSETKRSEEKGMKGKKKAVIWKRERCREEDQDGKRKRQNEVDVGLQKHRGERLRVRTGGAVFDIRLVSVSCARQGGLCQQLYSCPVVWALKPP
jgi:hypothetical protein